MKITQTFDKPIRHKLSFNYKKIVRYRMHAIKNISERNKIDTQSRANSYIRRKRLIIIIDYNLSLDARKSILETGKP
jgi:hypothetical protein